MAQWVTRPRADGGVSIQIKWRLDGRWQSETFTSARLAAEFRTAVEQAGNRWPEGWVKGGGWAPRTSPPVEVPKPTFGDMATGEGGYFAWQEKRVRLGKLKPRTLFGYRRTYALHLEETLASSVFEQIDAGDVADWLDLQIDSGAAAKSVRDRRGLLSSIIKHGALRMKLRPDNPCQVSALPDVNHGTSEVRQIRFFQREEWALFRSCLPEDFRLLMDLDLATRLRWGEISALRVGDLTLVSGVHGGQANIHVVRA